MSQDFPEPDPEKQSWTRFLSGNQQAFEQLYRHYYQQLFHYGYRLTGDVQAVREAIQQLFVKLWTNRSGLNDTPHVKQYLFKALRRHLVSRNSRELSYIPLSEDSSGPSQDTSREEKIIGMETAHENAQRIRVLLSRLTPRQQEAIHLRFFENLSYEEVAQVMDMQVGAAYKLVYRALDRLRASAGSCVLFLLCASFEKKFHFLG